MGNCNCNRGLITVVCPTECPDTPDYTFNNINLSGIGIVDSSTSVPTVNFRGLASANSMLTVTLDDVNHTVLFTLVASAIASALPAATTTQVGVLETATDAEALAKSATDKIVTPSNFAAMGSSTTFAGLIEIATLAEVQAGTAPLLAVTASSIGSQNYLSLAPSGSTAIAAAGTPSVTFGNSSSLTFTGSFSEFVRMDGVTFEVTNGGAFNLATGIQFQIGGSVNPSSIYITNGSSEPEFAAIAEFLSTYNTSPAWGAFTNAVVLKTCDVNTVTLPQLASILNTLITALKGVQLPAA